MRRILLLLLVACVCWGCPAGEDYLYSSEAGWTLFCYADASFSENSGIVQRAVQLDAYRRETTEEGRRSVHDRYFPRERIVEDGNVWRVLSPQTTWTFELSDGISLSEAGSRWRVVRKELGSDIETSVLISSPDGVTHSIRSKSRMFRFDAAAEMQLRIVWNDDVPPVLEFFAGDGMLRGKDEPRLDIDYSILEPVRIVLSQSTPQPGGTLFIKARNSADVSDDEVAARYLKDGVVEISYCGEVVKWKNGVPYWSHYPAE